MADQVPYATMKIGDWEYPLPRYMWRVLEIAGLADADYTIEEFIEKIDQVQHDPDRDGDISLFVDLAKLLLVEFARMATSNQRIGLADVQKAAEADESREKIDLVERALPKPTIGKH
jgi:hypothetical protein